MAAPAFRPVLSCHEFAALHRQFLEEHARLPTLDVLLRFESLAPYRYFITPDPPSVRKILPPDWQETADRLQAMHAEAVEMLKSRYTDLFSGADPCAELSTSSD